MPECSQYHTVGSEALSGLSDQDSTELLLKATQIPSLSWPTHELAAKQVTKILGSHTLALIQAGTYVAMEYCQLEQYPREYDRQRKRLLQFAPKQARSRYGDVYATFEVSARVLESPTETAASDALTLLGILSMLHHRDVPIQVFEDAWERSHYISDHENNGWSHLRDLTEHHVSTLPDFVKKQGERWDGFGLQGAICLLTSLALISVDCGFLSMHPLTHAWSTDRQSPDQQVTTWNSTGSVLAFSCYRCQTWLAYEKHLRLHIRHYLDRGIEGLYSSKQDDGAAMKAVVFLCLSGLLQMYDDSKVVEVLDWFFKELDIDSVVPSIAWLPLYNLKTVCLFRFGKYRQIIELWDQAVEVIPTRETQELLGVAYVKNGQSEKGIKLLKQIASSAAATLTEKHPDRLRSQYSLAVAYRANGQIEQAIELLKQIVHIQASTLAEDHPERLASEYELAVAYRINKQNEQAIELLKKIFDIKTSTLAENHPIRLASEYELAVTFRANGQIEQAIELLKQVVDIQTSTLAENHPNRLVSKYELAVTYKKNGQTKEAIELLKQIVDIQASTLAENHPIRLTSEYELAVTYRANGQIEQAIELLKQVVDIQASTLAENHPIRLASEYELAVTYRKNGQTKEAIKLLEQVVRLRDNFSELFRPQHQLAVAYMMNEQFKEAIELLEHVVRFKENPSRVLSSQYELAVAYRKNGQTKEAIELLEQVVNIEASTLTDNHPERFRSQHELAVAYKQNGQTKEAVKLMEQVVRFQ